MGDFMALCVNNPEDGNMVCATAPPVVGAGAIRLSWAKKQAWRLAILMLVPPPNAEIACAFLVQAATCMSCYSARIGPETSSKAPSTSSATKSRAGSTGPGMMARPGGTGLKPDLP
jgi:hypothetical protein